MQNKNSTFVYKFLNSEISYALLTKDNLDELPQYMIENNLSKLLIKTGEIGWNESYLPNLENFSFINELRIHWTNIKDISNIIKCPNIQILNIDNDDKTKIDFTIFNKLKKLVTWDRPNCETLWHLQELEELTIAGLKQSHIIDKSALYSIHKLRIIRSSILDLSILGKASELIYLELDGMTKLENISWLEKAIKLNHLLINANKITDFSIIRKLVNLEYCSINSKNGRLRISDFTNLKRLTFLNISGNEELIILNRDLDNLLNFNRFTLT